MWNDEEAIVSIKKCARCNADHDGLLFHPFYQNCDEYSHWAMCPYCAQPILLKILTTKPLTPR
jgi:DNA-directed RNA polymerase subunit RPC12/RpoP